MEKGFKALLAYQKAYKSAMEIFGLSKHFPMEEVYNEIGKLTGYMLSSPEKFGVKI